MRRILLIVQNHEDRDVIYAWGWAQEAARSKGMTIIRQPALPLQPQLSMLKRNGKMDTHLTASKLHRLNDVLARVS